MQFYQDKIRLSWSLCHMKRMLIKHLLAQGLAVLQLPANFQPMCQPLKEPSSVRLARAAAAAAATVVTVGPGAESEPPSCLGPHCLKCYMRTSE